MYSNEYLKELMESYTKPTVFPLDEDDKDDEDDNKAVFTQPTFKNPVLSTENDYEEVLKKPLPENNIKLAELSKDVYNDPDKRLREWDEYTLKPSYSNKFISTYVKDGNIIFAIRGTKEVEDLVLDLETPSGLLLNKRFKNLLEIVNKSIKNFKSKFGEVTFTGHSLGGLLSQMMGKEIIDSKTVTFNSATAPWLEQGKNKRIINYRIIGDPISKYPTLGKKINLRPKVPTAKMTKLYKNDPKKNIILPHTIDQFIDREILEDDPNIYSKAQFLYYIEVVKNLVVLGLGNTIYNKLIPLLGKYIYNDPQSRWNRPNIHARYMSEKQLQQRANKVNRELIQKVETYVNGLKAKKAIDFLTLTLATLSLTPGLTAPITSRIGDFFAGEEEENEEK